MIEIIGWIGIVCTLISFGVKDMRKLRYINGIGCIVWIVYGVLKEDTPIFVINICILFMHLYWFWNNTDTGIKKDIVIRRGEEWDSE
jgi:hypothetical protein